MGRKIAPSSRRITSGEPLFAQAFAHAILIGFSRPFVYAHEESITQPLIDVFLPLLLL
jgi:hypothetical protein